MSDSCDPNTTTRLPVMSPMTAQNLLPTALTATSPKGSATVPLALPLSNELHMILALTTSAAHLPLYGHSSAMEPIWSFVSENDRRAAYLQNRNGRANQSDSRKHLE